MDGGAAEPTGPLQVALAHARQLLQTAPHLAAEQAAEILRAIPAEPRARLVLGAARRLTGDLKTSLEILTPLAREQPRAAPVYLELGAALGEANRAPEAVAALRRAVELQPASPDGWRLLADQLDASADSEGATEARARYLKAANRDPRLMEAAAALVDNRLPAADATLRAHLALHPTDIAALRMRAEVAGRLRRYQDAQQLLERCLELAPGFDAARANYAGVLLRQGNAPAALAQAEQLLSREPRHPGYRNLLAAAHANVGSYAEAIAVYERLLEELPAQPRIWLSYGHALRTAGRTSDAIKAYRRAIGLEPSAGEAYWSLANLKTFRFDERDLAGMQAALARADLSTDDRLHFEFALGKALEDGADYAASFAHYQQGNAIRRELHPYSAQATTDYTRKSLAVYTREFFAARAGAGAPAADPIFIVGLPRAGSTLLEQILASHSQVEGLMELPHVPRLARDLASPEVRQEDFAEAVAGLTPARLRELGERYLTETRSLRRTAAPFFIDKMPNNCFYVGLIHLILPNARIIDARRHPLACGFSCFRQHFARGQNFTYDLTDLGLYYRDYVQFMAHIDRVLPGRVLRVHYERVVGDTEGQVRRLLEYCGLPFEDSCLRFNETARAVRTASSEQVRQPIFREGLDHWRHFEPWLGPLAAALGPILGAYPHEPESF
ncbi:MAG: sulfotransferase [Gammaproteobacteria bacterium]|nr:sulfotransferase [Gammaproteobacteria bacterium]MBV9620314.1 sulfotransferase [Gammaproteobacteria bacterium]